MRNHMGLSLQIQPCSPGELPTKQISHGLSGMEEVEGEIGKSAMVKSLNIAGIMYMLFILKTTRRVGNYHLHYPDEERERQRNRDSPRNCTADWQQSQEANLSLILKSMSFPLT